MRAREVGFLVVVGLLSGSVGRAAEPRLFCGGDKTTHQVAVDLNRTVAKVTRHRQAVRFGDLVCVGPGAAATAPVLVCRSRNVADAGFNAIFRLTPDGSMTQVELRAIWFGGERPLETLNCREIDDSPYHRVLYATGEDSLDGVHANARGTIEINIKTAAGTGYQWELERSVGSPNLSLVGTPEFIPLSSLPGGTGWTRFRFLVGEQPDRGFTLFFQLRRPWEVDAIKKFHMRFIADRP